MLDFIISSKRSEILRALEQTSYTRSAYLTLETVGVFAWPDPPGRPTRIGVDIVQVDGRVLPDAISGGFRLADVEQPHSLEDDTVVVTAEELETALEENRPQVISYDQTEWHLIAPSVQREVRDLDRLGRPIFSEVDTSVFCYKMVCARCGRVRYAKRNSLHEIRWCRVCTKQERLRARALQQYKFRERTGTHKRLAPHEVDGIVELVQNGATGVQAARAFGVTESAVSKILKRRGVR